KGAGAILSRMDSSKRERGCDLFLFADRKVGMHIIADWPSSAMKAMTSRPLPEGEWSHIVATYDGSGKAAGMAVYVNGEKQDLFVEFDKLNGSTANEQRFRIGGRSGNSPLHAAVAGVELFEHALSRQESQATFQASLRKALKVVKIDALADAMRSQLDKLLLAISTDPFAA